MSPKTTPRAERPSTDRLPEIAGRVIAAVAVLTTERVVLVLWN
jgi:hypothetical protein